MPNEQTSEKVASYAGLINPMKKAQLVAFAATEEGFRAIKACVASAHTQAPPRKKFLGLF